MLALTATVSFSIAPSVTRGAILGGIRPASLLMTRMIISLVLMGAFMALFTPRRLRIDQRGLLLAVASGLVNGFGFLTFFLALTRLEASVASMIFTLNPLAAIGMLALRGEKLTRRHAVRLALGIGGVYLLIGPSGQVDPTGALLVIITVFIFAFHVVSLQWFLQPYHAWTITFYVIVGIAIFGVGWWLADERSWTQPDLTGWFSIIALAMISTFLARLALFGGVRHLGSGQISLTVPLETFLSVLWSILFLHERLSLWQWLGGILILASMILAVQRLHLTRRRPRWRIWSRL
jgi:probable blue pigment (indigoidine) exporter